MILSCHIPFQNKISGSRTAARSSTTRRHRGWPPSQARSRKHRSQRREKRPRLQWRQRSSQRRRQEGARRERRRRHPASIIAPEVLGLVPGAGDRFRRLRWTQWLGPRRDRDQENRRKTKNLGGDQKTWTQTLINWLASNCSNSI